jgi:transposase
MVSLSPSQVAELRLLQKRNKDKVVYVKVTTLLMLHSGLSHEQTATYLGIDDSTTRRYAHLFAHLGDIKTYISSNHVAYSGKLTSAQESILVSELTTALYICSQEVVDYIQTTFGLLYTCSGVVALLHRLGFEYKKTKTVSEKACPIQQAEFLADMTSFLGDLDENTVVYFNDAVHPQHNTRPDYGWILKGDTFEMSANTGRYRLNLNAAINAHAVTDIVIREDKTINAQSTIALWEAQLQKHPDKIIYNICDNARYYHAKILKEWLEKHPEVRVIYLPPYSPNLNLIERLWKFLRKQVISYFYYDSFQKFRKAIWDFFKNIEQYRTALESLLTLKFAVVKT